MAAIGIEFGMNSCEAAHFRDAATIITIDGKLSIPCAVAWDEGELLVGHAAKDLATVLPTVLSWSRDLGTSMTYDLGGQKYTPMQFSTMLLRLIKRAAETQLAESVQSAVLSFPPYWSAGAMSDVVDAAFSAGFAHVQLIAEPMAVITHAGVRDNVLVFQLERSTFDVAIIDVRKAKILAIDGDNYLGGDDFDDRLMAHLAKEVKTQFNVDLESSHESRQRAKLECERVKLELSERDSSRIVFQTVIDGITVNLTLKITRTEFERLIVDLIDRTIEKVEHAITKADSTASDTGSGFTREDIQSVLLVGNSTRTPLVGRRMTEYFGKLPITLSDPRAVVFGAARRAAQFSDFLTRHE